MSGEASSLTGISNAGGSKLGNAILGYLFDPANASGLFGKNQGPGAFMNPNGRGGALYPGGPGLPGGNATGGGLNDAAGVIAGGELAGPALAGSSGASGAGILSPGASGGGGAAGWLSNANPFSAGFGTGHALSSDPALAGITPQMIASGGSSMPAAQAQPVPPSSGGGMLNTASQLASIANSLGVDKQQPQPQPMQAQPRNSSMPAVQQPPLPSANPQPQSPGNLPGAGGQMQVQAATNPQLKQLLASLGIG